MNKQKWIVYLDYSVLAVGALALVLFIGKALLKSNVWLSHLDVNWLAFSLIVFYLLNNGIKTMLKGNKKLGLYLVLFSVIVSLVAIILKLAILL